MSKFLIKTFIGILLILCFNTAKSQYCRLSNDGNFVAAADRYTKELTISSTKTNWNRTISAGYFIGFCAFDKIAVCSYHDTLAILYLGTGRKIELTGGRYASANSKLNDSTRFIGINFINKNRSLTIIDLRTKKTFQFDDIDDAHINSNSTRMWIQKGENLKWINLSDHSEKVIWQGDDGETVARAVFNDDGDQLAFLVSQSRGGRKVNSVWYYKNDLDKATKIVDESTPGADSLSVSDAEITFHAKSNHILFKLKENFLPVPKPDLEKVDVFTYLDARYQSLQLKDLNPKEFTAVISPGSKKVIRLEKPNELLLDQYSAGTNNDYLLLSHWEGDVLAVNRSMQSSNAEYNWNSAVKQSVYLVNLNDGRRVELMPLQQPDNIEGPCSYFSPNGKYVFYYSAEKQSYFSYNLTNGNTKIASAANNLLWPTRIADSPRSYYGPVRSVFWSTNNHSVFVRDSFGDLWKLDMNSVEKPISLTNGFFRRNQREILLTSYIPDGYTNNQVLLTHQIIIQVFDRLAGNLKHYCINLDRVAEPKLLIDATSVRIDRLNADQKGGYAFFKQSFISRPVACYTKDFKSIRQLWNTSVKDDTTGVIRKKLLGWKTQGGAYASGILYFPINFDSTRKYPVITQIHQTFTRSDYNIYSTTSFLGDLQGPIANIQYYLTHGYFVFRPDIPRYDEYECKLGNSAIDAFNSIVPSVQKLIHFPFIDSSRIGLTGNSFGAYEVNYIISHTNIFKAVSSGVGFVDLISYSVGHEQSDIAGQPSTAFTEVGQPYLGATLWERPDLYLKNSAIFYAGQINTPLLMGIGRKDTRCFDQEIELANALRRLGKRSWLLAYDNADHSLPPDWEIRMQQFFDHYLQDKPAPIWMTRGIPARLKGTTLGLEYDTEIKTPGPGLKIDKEIRTPQQEELLKHRTKVDDNGRIVDVPDNK